MTAGTSGSCKGGDTKIERFRSEAVLYVPETEKRTQTIIGRSGLEEASIPLIYYILV